MSIKATRLTEGFVTLLAVMGFLPSVDLHVLLKLPRGLEGLRTLVTRVRLDLTMNHHMGLQMLISLKCFGTQVTGMKL